MDSLITLYIGSTVRALTALFFLLAGWVLYRRKAEASMAAGAIGLHQLAILLANVPLLLSLEITKEYYLFHGVLMLLVSHLRLVAVAFLPMAWGNRGLDAWISRRRSWLFGVLGSFLFLAIAIMVLKSLPLSNASEGIAMWVINIDMLVNFGTLCVVAWYFWRYTAQRIGLNAVSYWLGVVVATSLATVFLFTVQAWISMDAFPSLSISVASILVLLVFTTLFLLVFGLILVDDDESANLPEGWLTASGQVAQIDGLELDWRPTRYQFSMDVLLDNGERKKLSFERDRLTKPGAHWLAFALATQHGIDLQHGDMNVVKFRMVDWWNKGTAHNIQQRALFAGTRGSYRLDLDAKRIKCRIDDELLDFDVVKEALSDFSISWLQAVPIRAEGWKKADLQQDRARWIALLLRGN